ncbi:papain-like cysteine protease family protein [Roseisolibacter sp. H3M3-2]|uniref:papain-like cysteine protease family protein n=1 Tax=Roseisolibacter sp. H3M3-2 TaxID=3031323 RepID=UPI0023DBEE41|nr:papain-like cysteine protease family protein [Roseisolibacter sp. H3M3-2]MDF1505167.1 papain-like cysteine protease family protein [Roseisolibacter sp. H3M3-2]
MQFIVNPLPQMEDQRFFPARSMVASVPYVGRIFKAAIDPTCGRYCLKSLLKWHKGQAIGAPVTSIEVGHQFGPPPDLAESGGRAQYALDYMLYLASNWIAYDPVVNFPQARALLTQSLKPDTVSGWQRILYSHGPIILTGVLGAATIPHVILLVGVDYAGTGRFFYLDPLAGDVLQNEPFAGMQARIDDQIVYGQKNIGVRI